MVDSGIRTRHLRLLNRDDTNTCIIQDTNDSADLNSARQGQFQEKEKKLFCFVTKESEILSFLFSSFSVALDVDVKFACSFFNLFLKLGKVGVRISLLM